MRRGWTRFLACISAITLAASAAARRQEPAKGTASPGRHNEVTLAGLRPGRDTGSRAVYLYREPPDSGKAAGEVTWTANCAKETLTIELDQDQKVQTVRATEARWLPGDCNKYRPTAWKTGRGLRIGDIADRAVQLYGRPDSRSPSTKHGQQLELLYYAFDWAGPDVPQVMEVLCTVGKNGEPGRVVEITLAASSL